MSIVYEDEHSKYVIFNGSVNRPVPTFNDTGPVLVDGEWRKVGDEVVSVEVGQNVKVKMIGHSPYFLVDGSEVWTTHGQRHYYDSKNKKLIRNRTEDCWRKDAQPFEAKIDGGHL